MEPMDQEEEGAVMLNPPPRYYYCTATGETTWFLLHWFVTERPLAKIVVKLANSHSVRLYQTLFSARGIPVIAVHSDHKSRVKRARYASFSAIEEGGVLLCTDMGFLTRFPAVVDWFIQFHPPYAREMFFVNAVTVGAPDSILFLRPEEIGFVDGAALPPVAPVAIPQEVSLRTGLNDMVEANELNERARRACKAFLKTYRQHGDGEIFNINVLNIQGVVRSFGIPNSADEMAGI